VALQGAREGVVLLKNAGALLPLDSAKVKKIVLLGRMPTRQSWERQGAALCIRFTP
jgi:beta-glucosidase-like glycosyl hydrolase